MLMNILQTARSASKTSGLVRVIAVKMNVF